MIRNRGWLVALLALGLGVSACKKNDDKAAPAGDKVTDKVAGAAAGAAEKAGATDDLSLLPADSEGVFSINFGQVQQSALWKQYVAPKLASATTPASRSSRPSVATIQSSRSSRSLRHEEGLGGTSPTGVVVVRGLDKTKSMTCFDKDVADAEKDGSKVVIDGDVALITDKSGKQFGFTFVNDSTAVAVIGPDGATKDGVKKVASGGGALKTSPAFVDMYSKIKTGDSLWLVINGSALAGAPLPVKLKAAFGSINVTDGLTLDVRVRTATADEATSLQTLVKGQTNNPQVKEFFDKLEVGTDGTDLTVSVGMSAEKLKMLAGLAGGMNERHDGSALIKPTAALVLALGFVSAGGSCGKKSSAPVAELSGLAAVPASAEVVIAVDVPRVTGSPLVQRAADVLLARDADLTARWQKLRETCKLDVGKIDHVLLAIGTTKARSPAPGRC